MTLLVIEGFDNVNTAQDLFAGILTYASATAQCSFAVSTSTQFGGKCLNVTTSSATGNSSYAYTSIYFATASSTVVGGTSILLSPTASSGYDIGFTNNLAAQIFCRFVLNGVQVFRGDPAGTPTLLGSAVTGLSSSGWAYVELRATIATGTSGSITVFVNGNQIINLTSINTSNDGTAIVNGFAVGANDTSGNGFTASYDNIYVLDNFGIAPNNTVLGPTRVITRTPSSNSSVQFTPVANTNWQEVDEINFDADATYNFSTVVPSADTFAAFALPSTTSQVFAIQVKAAVRKDDAGNRTMGTALVSSGTTAAGAIYALSPNYQYITDIYPTDPHTSSAWTTSAVNFSTFGYTLLG